MNNNIVTAGIICRVTPKVWPTSNYWRGILFNSIYLFRGGYFSAKCFLCRVTFSQVLCWILNEYFQSGISATIRRTTIRTAGASHLYGSPNYRHPLKISLYHGNMIWRGNILPSGNTSDPDWNFFHRLSERPMPLGIMRCPLKPYYLVPYYSHWCWRGFRGALNGP